MCRYCMLVGDILRMPISRYPIAVKSRARYNCHSAAAGYVTEDMYLLWSYCGIETFPWIIG